MNPYIEIHKTLERFQNDFLRLITEEVVNDEDINKVYRKYDDELMAVVKRAEIETLNHALEYMGQFPDFNLANMYEYIKDKEEELEDGYQSQIANREHAIIQQFNNQSKERGCDGKGQIDTRT